MTMKPGVNPKKGLRILLSLAPNKTLSPENPFFFILLSVRESNFQLASFLSSCMCILYLHTSLKTEEKRLVDRYKVAWVPPLLFLRPYPGRSHISEIDASARKEKEKFIDISTTDYRQQKKGLRIPIQARVEWEALLEEDLSPKRAFIRPPERTHQKKWAGLAGLNLD